MKKREQVLEIFLKKDQRDLVDLIWGGAEGGVKADTWVLTS